MTDLTEGQRALLFWLSKEAFSQFGECYGTSLDQLIELGLAQVHGEETGRDNTFIAKGRGSVADRAGLGNREGAARNCHMTRSLNQRLTHLDLPDRMLTLPVSDEGYPIPWFVGYPDGPDGAPDFRTMDGEKMAIAIRLRRCWMCGQPLGKHLTFCIGPMCIVNRNIAEPPSHLSCVEYAVKACPFLSQPRMKRNEKELPEDSHVAGIGLKRNPGVQALWTTLKYRAYRAPNGGALFELGDPEHIEFYAEGRRATREEILASMESGLPLLLEVAQAEGREAEAELQQQYARALQLVPA
jgi:hypothetical protein